MREEGKDGRTEGQSQGGKEGKLHKLRAGYLSENSDTLAFKKMAK